MAVLGFTLTTRSSLHLIVIPWHGAPCWIYSNIPSVFSSYLRSWARPGLWLPRPAKVKELVTWTKVNWQEGLGTVGGDSDISAWLAIQEGRMRETLCTKQSVSGLRWPKCPLCLLDWLCRSRQHFFFFSYLPACLHSLWPKENKYASKIFYHTNNSWKKYPVCKSS